MISFCFVSPSRLLQQKTIIKIENDIVAGDVLLLVTRKLLRFDLWIDPEWSPFIYLFIFVKSASELAAIRAGINLVPTAFVTLVQRNGKTKYPWDKQNSCYSG